jgi:hypothetical protein
MRLCGKRFSTRLRKNFDRGFSRLKMGGSAVAEPLFFFCGGVVILLGFLRKCVFLAWCFCGEFVVECVVNVVR